jgi:hypothetical protein
VRHLDGSGPAADDEQAATGDGAVGPRRADPIASVRTASPTTSATAASVSFDVTQHVVAPDPWQAAAESAQRLRAFVFERTGAVVA